MPCESLQLIEPTLSLREEYLAFVGEFIVAGEQMHGVGGMNNPDFALGVQACAGQALGLNVPDGRVPASTFWAVTGGTRIVGTVSVRHQLNDFLKYEGGHVAYSVRPSERRKGYGTRMLAMALDVARHLGLGRVLVTCDNDNPASAGVIRNNGGVLENEVVSNVDGKTVQRYWITL